MQKSKKCNKTVKVKVSKSSIVQKDKTKGFSLIGNNGLGFMGSLNPLSLHLW